MVGERENRTGRIQAEKRERGGGTKKEGGRRGQQSHLTVKIQFSVHFLNTHELYSFKFRCKIQLLFVLP